MIKATRINGGIFVINSDMIEFIEEKPETIICLTTGKKIMVRETIDDIIEKVSEFRKRCNENILHIRKQGIDAQPISDHEIS
ncbi:MAG: flagellar FlbD family protein [candidate division Zixibacteria bacterium]|nr:flagellar FlbD family protein [candidate division Zixibacteria bacterium]